MNVIIHIFYPDPERNLISIFATLPPSSFNFNGKNFQERLVKRA